MGADVGAVGQEVMATDGAPGIPGLSQVLQELADKNARNAIASASTNVNQNGYGNGAQANFKGPPIGAPTGPRVRR